MACSGASTLFQPREEAIGTVIARRVIVPLNVLLALEAAIIKIVPYGVSFLNVSLGMTLFVQLADSFRRSDFEQLSIHIFYLSRIPL